MERGNRQGKKRQRWRKEGEGNGGPSRWEEKKERRRKKKKRRRRKKGEERKEGWSSGSTPWRKERGLGESF